MMLLERLNSNGPKRILSLDGGGIRGALTLGYLEKVEETLRNRHGNPNLKLCEYFDLIGGTSTGSIIAAGLAIGMNASDVKKMYLDLGEKVFTKNRFFRRLKATYNAGYFKVELEKVFGSITLGDLDVKTGLAIFAKRADTGSTWIVHNHPKGKYYTANKNILLRRLIRASAAAPTYFQPEKIDVGRGEEGIFVDGGVSMVNNPSLMMFLMTSIKGFPFHWEKGENNILLVSVGTGTWQPRMDVGTITGAKIYTWAKKVPSMLMYDANQHNQLILQLLSNTKTPSIIDSEIGDLSLDCLIDEPLLSYVRYNAFIDENGLNELGLSFWASKIDSLREMSIGKNRFDLAKIGEKSAEKQVMEEHFPRVFDI